MTTDKPIDRQKLFEWIALNKWREENDDWMLDADGLHTAIESGSLDAEPDSENVNA